MDDLESLFWVVVWSVAFNEDHISLPTSKRETEIRKRLAEGDRINAVFDLRGSPEESDIMQRFCPFIEEWWERVNLRGSEWAKKIVANAPAGAGEGYYLPRFHHSALQGVIDFLEVVSNHQDEIGVESWMGPTQQSHLQP